MRLISVFMAIAFFAGCTTFRPIGLTPSELQSQTVSKKDIEPGDQVKIVTIDGKHYKFKVAAITDDYVEGEKMKVPVVDIVSIETKEFSWVKTLLLTVGLVGLVQALVAVGSTPEIMDPQF